VRLPCPLTSLGTCDNTSPAFCPIARFVPRSPLHANLPLPLARIYLLPAFATPALQLHIKETRSFVFSRMTTQARGTNFLIPTFNKSRQPTYTNSYPIDSMFLRQNQSFFALPGRYRISAGQFLFAEAHSFLSLFILSPKA